MTLEQFRTYMIGFRFYAEGESIEACATEQERRGYNGARLGHMHSDNVEVAIDAVPAEQVDALARRMTLKEVMLWEQEDQNARVEEEWNRTPK